MKIVRFLNEAGVACSGVETAPGMARLITGDLYGKHVISDDAQTVHKLLAPIVPTQILCIGLNYRRHAAESNAPVPERPIMFAKGINTLQNPGDPILIPVHTPSQEVDYECELAVVIGRGPDGRMCKNVSSADAFSYVAGYTCANDVSARDWQLKFGGGQWCRGKFFDTFCPLGPCMVTPDEIGNPNALRIRTLLNGQTVQDWNTSDMIFDVPALISFLSGSTTLVPGTVILTGTPHGVGMAAKPQPRWLRPGDEVLIEIEGIGSLRNTVALESVNSA
jgi:2-keto-4-pentenoate hydratase/2-oxohepta-3-ene-1,7-dioic acid hydratase in catechol pathway